jgi:hypothetical protein
MARRYVRDAKGRFAPKGYSGQTGGRGARLKSGKGNIREVGGQKRGERHVLRSSESKAAGRAATAAAVKSGGIIVSRKYGGQGKSRDSAEFKAAQAAKRVAQAKRDAAERKSGLPKSGGAMRVKGGIKRDPKAGERLKALRQPKASGARNPAAKPKDGRDIMLADVRKMQNKRLSKLNQKIKDAGSNAAGLRLEKLQLQTRMSATRPKPTAKQKAKSAKQDELIRARSAEMRRQSAKIAAAQQQVNAAPTASRQKQKWAAAAEKRRAQADRAEANAKRLRDANRRVGDTAFWTQPGLGKQRDKARAGLEKSFREQERAKALRSKANNLERMSKTTKGAAASRQQSRRDAFDAKKIKKGDTVNSILYGQVKVLRVNKKTVTISVNGGKPFTEDKSRFSI